MNATWTASSFCGSYTCKLRKRNVTVTFNEEQAPDTITPIVTTENEAEVTTFHSELNISTTTAAPEPKSVLSVSEQKSKPIINISQHKDLLKTLETVRESSKERNAESDDRYLTDGEIRALFQLLQAAKKSDLEAMIEVYNLAQDIYKEMDSTNDDNSVEDAIKDIKSKKHKLGKEGIQEKIKNFEKNMDKKRVSYWYEPKAKTVENDELTIPVVSKVKNVPKDMFFEGSQLVPEVAIPRQTPPPHLFKHTQQTVENKEFPKLPYYYPITNFQRVASYVNPQHYDPRYVAAANPPCKHQHNPPNMYPYIPTIYNTQKSYQDIYRENYVHPAVGNHRQTAVVSTVLPYPFAYIHYNVTSPYFSGNPWQYINLYNNKQLPRRQDTRSYLDATYVANIPNAVLINPDLTDDIQDIEQKPVNKNLIDAVGLKNKANEEKTVPEWQTDPLSTKILSEVKANMETKAKLLPFPFRKKVKLERVGKLIKMDNLSRPKRNHLLRRLKRQTMSSYLDRKDQPETKKVLMPSNGTENKLVTSKIDPEKDKKKIRSKRQRNTPVTVTGDYEVYVEKTT